MNKYTHRKENDKDIFKSTQKNYNSTQSGSLFFILK